MASNDLPPEHSDLADARAATPVATPFRQGSVFIAHSDADKPIVRALKKEILKLVAQKHVRRRWPASRHITSEDIFFDEDNHDPSRGLENFATVAAQAACLILVVPNYGVRDDSFMRKEVLAFLTGIVHSSRIEPDPRKLTESQKARAKERLPRLLIVDRHDCVRWRDDTVAGLTELCRSGCLSPIFREELPRLRDTARSVRSTAVASVARLWQVPASEVMDASEVSRRRRLWTLAAIAAGVAATFAVLFLLALAARSEAAAERDEAERQRKQAEENKAEAISQTEEARRQKKSAEFEANALRDRLYLAAAERAIDVHDPSDAARFLGAVSSRGRNQSWYSTAFKVAPKELALWSADEMLIGGGETSFVTMSDDGVVRLRELTNPSSALELDWPFVERPAHDSPDAIAVILPSHLVVTIGGRSALWQLQGQRAPLFDARQIQTSLGGEYLLVQSGAQLGLRASAVPLKNLATLSTLQDRWTGWHQWTRAGVVVSTDHDQAYLLSADGRTEMVPFAVERALTGYFLQDAILVVRERPRGRTAKCLEQRVEIREIGAPWTLIGTVDVCDSPFAVQRSISRDRWVFWEPSGLGIVKVDAKRADVVHVDWARIAECIRTNTEERFELYPEPARCEINFSPDAERVYLETVSNKARERLYEVDLVDGDVEQIEERSQLREARSFETKIYDEMGNAHSVHWGDDRTGFSHNRSGLLLWPIPRSIIGGRPVAIEMPQPSELHSPEVRVVLGQDRVVAGLVGVPRVDVWQTELRSSEQRHQGAQWLRDGSVVSWKVHSPAGVPSPLLIRVQDAGNILMQWSALEDPGCLRADRDGREVPDRAILSANGHSLLVEYGGRLTSIDMQSRVCISILATDNLERDEIALSDDGRWLVGEKRGDLLLWDADMVQVEPYAIAGFRHPVLSPTGSTLLATRVVDDVQVAFKLTRDRDGEISAIESVQQPPGLSIDFLSNGGSWGIVTEPGNRRGDLVDVEGNLLGTLLEFPDQVKRAVFDNNDQRIGLLSVDGHRVYVWSLDRWGDVAPWTYSADSFIVDITWRNDGRLALLYFDGTQQEIPATETAIATWVADVRGCVTPSARNRFLEESPATAKNEAHRCQEEHR